MSITRLQQARQMYALGQRVAKTMDGSRPGYRGSDWGGSDYGDPSSNTNTSNNNGGPPQHSPHTDTGYTGPTSYGPPAPVDRSKVGQFSQYGRNVMNQNLQGPSFISKIGEGIGNYITSGGLIGAGIRGLTGLVNKFTGPKATEYGNLNTPGYNMLNIAGPVEYDFGDPEGPDSGRDSYATTNQYTIPTSVEEEGITTLANNPDFLQRFRVKNPYRQDKQGELDPAILEMINKLYT